MKTTKQKSLAQVAYEAHTRQYEHQLFWHELISMDKSHWRRVARAVVKAHEKRLWSKATSGDGSTWTVKAAKVKPHLNSAAKVKHN